MLNLPNAKIFDFLNEMGSAYTVVIIFKTAFFVNNIFIHVFPLV